MGYIGYISQSILFGLAIIGTLFKSTKTDAEGKPLHGSSGLPLLTRSGKVVVTLLTISFAFSLVTVWKSARAAAEAEKESAALKGREEGIYEGVQKSILMQETGFRNVLETQTETGEKISGDLDFSTNKLKNGIDTSTTLLGGKVNNSITLLNHSADKMAAISDPITTIKTLEVRLDLPLDEPPFSVYREAFDNYSRREGGDQKTVMIDQRNANPQIIVACNLLAGVVIHVSFYKTPLEDRTLKKDQWPVADLSFWWMPAPEGLDWFYYNVEKHRLELHVQRVLFVPRVDPRAKDVPPLSPINPWEKKAAGEINGIPDLLNSQFIADLSVPGADAATRRVAGKIEINKLDMIVSDELYLTYVGDGDYSDHIFGWIWAHRMRGLREVRRKDGSTAYVYPMPGSIPELIGSPSIP